MLRHRNRLAVVFVGIASSMLVGLGGCTGKPEDPAQDRTNVLLVTIDTLRADRLGCYGYHLPTSPNIDRLAARGARFADCTVQWPKTWPSMASLLTGAYPKTIGQQERQRFILGRDALLLSEVFQGAGYRTGAVVSNFNIGKAMGFDQGFDGFVESWQEAWTAETGSRRFINRPGRVKRYTDARIVTDQGLQWLRESDGGKPFFLWLHYMEPHGPYVPPEEYRGLFEGAYPSEPVELDKLPEYQLQSNPETRETISDLAHYRAQYDREVRFLDDQLARLFDELEAMGVDFAETLVVFAADHGESFSEHEYYLEHGQFSYQACAWVPLIFVQDGKIEPGRVIDEPVGLLDASVTVLELAGLEVPATFEGQSLTPLIAGEEGASPREYVFMEAGYEEESQLTIRQGKWKLILVRSSADRELMTGAEYELYDVRADPGELDNLAGEHPGLVARLSEVLLEWYRGGPSGVAPGEELDVRTLTPQEQEMLRSLGYVQ